jgi:membrane fusion protein, multidrug efflux system
MKRNLIIILSVIIIIGACTATLLFNKKKIDEKSKLDGNLKTIPVFIIELKKSKLSGTFEVNGSFTAIHELTVMSETQGKVVDYEFEQGDFVSKGQLLARLDDEIVRNQLAYAEALLSKTRADMKKYEDLLKEDAVSGQQYEAAQLDLRKVETEVATLRKQLEFTVIKAPIQGTVTKRLIETGSMIMPGSPVAEIVDVSRLKFIANLVESEAVQVRKGERVTIFSSLFPGIVYDGTILSVGVKADDAKRYPVEIEVINTPGHSLKDGMFGTATFSPGNGREALMIPRHSIVGSIKTPHVYVVDGNIAMLKEIRIGAATDTDVEVMSGLKEGDKVVTSGQINLSENMPVSIVNTK